MANTYIDYVAASNTVYSFSFPYIEASHVKVYVGGTARTQGTHYTVATSPTRIEFTAGNTPAVGSIVTIRRETYKDAAYVDFVQGATILESDLDRSFRQNLYINQENSDLATDSLTIGSASVNYSARGKRIESLSDPVNSQDAVTRQYLTNYADVALRNAGGLTPYTWTLTGNGSTTVFNLSLPTSTATASTLTSAASYLVVVGGVVQTPNVSYTLSISSGFLYITFAQAPANSVAISVVQLGYATPTVNLNSEQGEWTPTYASTTGALTGIPYTRRWGTYTKIGSTVLFSGEIEASQHSTVTGASSGSLIITGIPFNSASGRNFSGAVAYSSGFSSMPHDLYVSQGATTANINLVRRSTGTSSTTALAYTATTHASNSTWIMFEGMFNTA